MSCRLKSLLLMLVFSKTFRRKKKFFFCSLRKSKKRLSPPTQSTSIYCGAQGFSSWNCTAASSRASVVTHSVLCRTCSTVKRDYPENSFNSPKFQPNCFFLVSVVAEVTTNMFFSFILFFSSPRALRSSPVLN